MNKIYKVVWSKVKHCYVVTSELAKRQTKGCGARSLRMATVSLGVAASLLCAGAVLPIFCPSVAEAAIASAGSTIVQTDYRGMYTFQADSKTFTVDESATSATNNYAYGNVAMGKLYLESSIYEMHDEKLVRVDTFAFGAPYTTMVLTANPLYNTLQVEQLGVKTTISAIVKASETVAKDVSGYKVTITGGTLDEVMGGLSYSGNVSNNAVEMSNGTASNVYGGYSDTGNANENTVTISGGSVSNVYCGKGSSSTKAGEASRNQVFISNNANVSNQVIGGTADTITYKNSVTISGGKVYSVVGAQNYDFGENALASFNEVAIKGSAQVTESVYGARDGGYGSPIMSDNTVTIDGSAVVSGNVFGASGFEKDKTNNKVYINNGSVTGDVYGGLLDYNAEYKGNLIKNEVNISGGKVTGNVYGGAIINKVIGDIKGNKVEITGGTLKEDNYVYGGYGISNSVGGSEAGDGNKVIVSGGEVKSTMVLGGFSSTGAAMGNSVEITGEGKVSRTVYGGYSTSGTAGGEGTNDGNKVIVSGGEAQDGVIGGCSVSGVATGNSVVISGGKVGLSTEATSNIYGGYSYKNAATGNKVTISNGSLGENYAVQIFGGYGGSGVADTNEVNLSGGTIGNYSKVSYIYGGWGSKTSASGNTVKITDGTLKGGVVTGGFTYNGTADSNIIKMSGGTLSNTSITGGKGSTSASGNKVTISGGQSGTVYGGVRSDGTPTVNQNEVTIKGKDTVVSEVYGGYGGAETNGNKVLIEESTVNNNVYGGDIDSTDTTMKAQNNEVTVKGATVKGSIYGAISFGGTATSNTVNISDGATAITGTVWGGLSANSDATENKVIINGGNIGSSVIGGNTTYGKNATDNTVTIEDGTITRGIYGGLSQNAPGTAINNKVIINGGIINGIVKGGESDKGNATNNTVTIKGGTVTERVIGGNANISGDANGNTITISGGTIGKEGAGTSIWGGYASSGGASNNTVTISGDAQLLGNVSIYGAEVHGTTDVANANNNTVNILAKIKASQLAGGNAAGTSSDNTLNIAATGVTAGSVYAFQTVALTSALTWSDGETVLSANNFDDDDSIKATLDISAATNLASATSGQMTLLASQTDNDLNALSLTYDGGTATLNSSNQSQIVKEGSSTPSTDNGVTVNVKGIHTVSLDAANSYKNVLYSVDNQAKSLSFAQVTFGKGSTARDLEDAFVFDDATTVDATNLTFAESTSAIAKGDSMTLAAGAKGLAAGTEVTKGKDKTVAVNYEDKQKIKYEATASGDVTTVAGAVKYTVGKVELTNVALAGWTGTASDVTKETKGWTVTDSTEVNTDGISVSGMNPGDVRTVLTADTTVQFATKHLTGGNVWQAGGKIDDSGDKTGVTVAGTSTGGGVKVNESKANELLYQQSKNDVTEITLGTVKYDTSKAVRSFGNAYDLTNAGIDATAFKLSNLDDVKASMKTGDTMVIVDAAKAIANAKGETLQGFTVTPEPMTVDFKDEKVDGKELTFEGTHKDTLSLNDKKTQVVYKVGEKEVNKATFTGEVAWNDSEAYYTNDTSKYKIAATNVDATDLKVTGTSTKALQKGDAMTLLSAEGMTATLAKDQSDANKTASKITVNYSDAASGIGFGATATGAVEATDNAVNYEVDTVTLNSVDLAGWNGTTSSVPGDWAIADGATIKTDGMAAPAVEPGSHVDILQNDTDNYFASATISGANTYQSTDFKDEMNGVTLEGKQDKGVTLNSEKKHLIYAAGTKNTASVSFGAVEWQKDATLVDAVAGYDFTNVSEIGTDKFDVTYAKPEDVAINDSMTLLKANETLTAIVDELKTSSYKNYEIAPGVLMDGSITGTMNRSGNDVVFTATANQADKLTFTDVEWKDSGALMTRPANVMFAGADVDTAKINFHNIQELAANSRMTLVSDFGETVGTITGDTFTVGSGLQGEGAASLSGTDLVFTAKTGAESLTPTEATHETVMAMEAGTAVVAAGREYVDSAVEGLGLVSNMAPDGTSTFASMGGGVGRYKTGSHVDTHTWSAVVAVGSKRDHKKGNLEWGVFAEYGRGNYTLHDDNGGRGDGNTHYAGGGLLAKWTNKHDVYTEASFRMGRMSDSASNMLRDVLGNTYGYDVHANYFGGHVGLGKIYKVKGNKDLDVYGKFFYTRRNGVDFDAGGNQSNDRKWNWYGGLAYEYEFGGESKGTVDGLAIRSASIKGASVRGEIGVRLEATKTNPWKADISIYGYGGKHRGIGGTVSVAYMF